MPVRNPTPLANARSRLPLWLRIAGLVGMVALVAALGIRQAYLDAIENQHLEQFAATADYVARSLQSSLDTIESQTASIVGLVFASDEVTSDELARFVAMNEQTLGVAGWGIVEPAGDTMPVRIFQPVDQPGSPDWSGRDLAEERATRAVIGSALGSGEPSMSRFMRLESGAAGAVLAVPAPLSSDRQLVAVAVIDIDEFEAIATRSVSDIARVTLSESTGTPSIGSFVPERAVGLAGRRWSVAISPAETLEAPSPVTSTVAAVVVALTVGALAGALVRRRELQASLERTRALNQARDEFLGVISHEIRTPLTAVVGFAGELRSSWELLGREEREDMLRLVDEQAQEVAAIVSDLLVAGRADIHSLHIGVGPVNLAEVARLAVDSVPWRDRSELIRAECTGVVYADRGRLTQVIRNLLVNAARYGGPRVTLETRRQEGMIDVVMSDDGEGIPEEFASAVFDRYFALPRESAALPSMGLGLYVSRRLAEVMGGSLRYERTDGWSRFIVSMPCVRDDETPAQPGVSLGTQAAGSQAV